MEADASVLQTLRLLVALAGGSDGCSFVLVDPTRVSEEVSKCDFCCCRAC